MLVYRVIQIFSAFIAFYAFCNTADTKQTLEQKIIYFIACFLFLALVLFIEKGLIGC